jgi:protein TonB
MAAPDRSKGTDPARKMRLLRIMPLLGVAAVALFTAAVVFAIKAYVLDAPPAPKKNVQQVTLIQPPPPPPPKAEPPPPEVKQEVEVEQPQEQPQDVPEAVDDTPVGDDLGLDAEGGAGGDAFGLIGKKGGRGFLEGGVNAWYKGIVQQELKDLLNDRIEQLKAIRYTVRLKIRLDPDGRFTLVALEGTTGDAQVDAALRKVLAEGRLREKPPEHLAGLMKVQINSTI